MANKPTSRRTSAQSIKRQLDKALVRYWRMHYASMRRFAKDSTPMVHHIQKLQAAYKAACK